MPRDDILDKYVPLVDRLTSCMLKDSKDPFGLRVFFFFATAHWYNLRAAACALYPTLYKIVGDEQFKVNVLQ